MRYLKVILFFMFFFPVTAHSLINELDIRSTGSGKFLGFITVYDAFLYSTQSVSPEQIMSPETSKCLELIYHVSLNPEELIEGAETILSKQHTEEELLPFRTNIDTIHNAYEPVEKGDKYVLCFNATTEITTLRLNERVVASVTSKDFSSIYFGIWLGEKEPLSESLRDELLEFKR